VKKTILATAIAAVISGPAAAIESDMYGNIRLSLRSADNLSIDSSKLIIGWKGSEDLGNGNTASFKLEMEHDDANTKNGVWDNDRSWVALGGDWGKVTLGREDTFDGWSNGGTDVYAINGGNITSSGNELDNGIQYRGGSGAFKFGIGAEIFSSGGLGKVDAVAASTNPVTAAVAGVAGASFTNITYGVSFSGENWQVGAHGADADSDASTSVGIGSQIAPGDTSLDVGGYYTFGNFTLGATLTDNGAAANETASAVVLAFPLGPCGALVGLETGDSLDAAATGTSGDILNLGYNCSSGAAYYGLEYNDDDDAADALFIAYYGLRW